MWVTLSSAGKPIKAVPTDQKLWVQIQSTDMIFYFLFFSATTSPGTQCPKLTIIVNLE